MPGTAFDQAPERSMGTIGQKRRVLTEKERTEIVSRSRVESERSLARAFGISRSRVWDIKQAAKKAAA